MATDDYWGRTDQILRRRGAPRCPHCGKPMAPADDHGRFVCLCQGYSVVDGETGQELRPQPLPQVDTSGMTDEQKAAIPPIFRLDDTPTAAEAAFFETMLTGDIDALDSPEHQAAARALKEERGE